MGSATTAARKVVLSSTLIGLFEFERERERPVNLSARSNFNYNIARALVLSKSY